MSTWLYQVERPAGIAVCQNSVAVEEWLESDLGTKRPCRTQKYSSGAEGIPDGPAERSQPPFLTLTRPLVLRFIGAL